MNNILLDVLSLGAVLSSVLVITSKNPVIAVIFLISLFVNTAGYLIVLGIGFVGISYIIIYIGAITVLFLFIIMMINIRLVDILETGNEYTKNLPLAFLVGSLFIYEIFSVLPFTFNNVFIIDFYSIFSWLTDRAVEVLNFFNNLILTTTQSSQISTESFNYTSGISSYLNTTFNTLAVDANIVNFLQIEVLGQGIYTYGAIWLLICSIILLLAMLSAIFLSKTSLSFQPSKVRAETILNSSNNFYNKPQRGE